MNYIQRSETVKGSELPITNMIRYSTQLTHYFPLEMNDSGLLLCRLSEIVESKETQWKYQYDEDRFHFKTKKTPV